jgi:rhodanese-related sulfurtransferase
VPQISTAELADWLADGDRLKPILIDARKPEEFEVSHLAGAKRAGSLQEALGILSGEVKDRPIVVYCSVGYRSSSLAAALIGKGFTRVYNLEGSIFEWANEGRPVYSHGKRVRRVHPYDDEWGRLLDEELRYDTNAENK